MQAIQRRRRRLPALKYRLAEDVAWDVVDQYKLNLDTPVDFEAKPKELTGKSRMTFEGGWALGGGADAEPHDQRERAICRQGRSLPL